MRSLILALLLVGCSRTPEPKAPTTDTGYRDKLYCFTAQTVGGNGLACTDRKSTCRTLRGLTSRADGVEETSDCILSAVTVTKD